MATLQAENEAKNSTIFTLLRTSEAALDVENVEVNPRHPNFAEDGGPLIHLGSIVPKISMRLSVSLTKGAIETDALRTVRFNWLPIYIAFLDSLDAEDSKLAIDIENILELQHDTGNKDTYPLFSGTKLGVGSQPLSTVPVAEAFGDYGLSVSSVMESVAFASATYFDCKQYMTNRGMLNKVTGKYTSVMISRDKPYIYTSNNFTYPSVKRGNEYTFCGILVHCEQGSSGRQPFLSTDTSVIDHLLVQCDVRYDEWNSQFEQAQM